ncbi:UTRA domain-containing protein, partial [Escherichia coli]|nr:UTRA domain-containing protein [Escherichia coli]
NASHLKIRTSVRHISKPISYFKIHLLSGISGGQLKIIGTFETFSPTFPTPEIASILRISPRDPILKIQTQAVDSNSIPLDYSLLYSNIFEFQVKYFFPR